jgi:hypothetical protein
MSGKRLILAGTAVFGVFWAPAYGAAAPPPTRLVNPSCHRALLPAARRIAITAVMRPVTGTTGMAMRFDLQRAKRRAGPFVIVRGRGLAQWIRPDNPTLGQRPGDVWNFDQKVENLPGTASYRFRVRFRWTGANGRTLGTAAATGPVCFEPELRPDLLVRSLTVRPIGGQPSQDRYIAVIGNRGRTAAGPFEIELVLPAKPPQTMSVLGLGPHATIHEQLAAPACTAGDQLRVIVDPTAAVLDYDRANNTLPMQCP